MLFFFNINISEKPILKSNYLKLKYIQLNTLTYKTKYDTIYKNSCYEVNI